ncbi:hypothetical protein D3C76_224560 [compost metagenome]
MEVRCWFVAETYVNAKGATVGFFAYSKGSYGMHITENINDPNILYFENEEAAKDFAYKNVANTNRTVHCRYLDSSPINLKGE